jgi:hypothetical protein
LSTVRTRGRKSGDSSSTWSSMLGKNEDHEKNPTYIVTILIWYESWSLSSGFALFVRSMDVLDSLSPDKSMYVRYITILLAAQKSIFYRIQNLLCINPLRVYDEITRRKKIPLACLRRDISPPKNSFCVFTTR